MSEPEYGPQLELKSLEKEFREFNKDLKKKLKDLGVKQQSIRPVMTSFEKYRKQTIAEFKKIEEDGMVPAKDGLPKLEKQCSDWCKVIHVEGVEGIEGVTGRTGDAVKFSVGSKNLKAGVKLKFDEKKQQLKADGAITVKVTIPTKEKGKK